MGADGVWIVVHRELGGFQVELVGGVVEVVEVVDLACGAVAWCS